MMKDSITIIFGLILLITFNIFVGLLASVAFKSLSVLIALLFTVPGVIGAVYFDFIMLKSFISFIKSKRNGLK